MLNIKENPTELNDIHTHTQNLNTHRLNIKSFHLVESNILS